MIGCQPVVSQDMKYNVSKRALKSCSQIPVNLPQLISSLPGLGYTAKGLAELPVNEIVSIWQQVVKASEQRSILLRIAVRSKTHYFVFFGHSKSKELYHLEIKD